jgi:hypothetical protein
MTALLVVCVGSRIFGPFESLAEAGAFIADLPRPVDARFVYLSDPAEWQKLLAPMKVIDGHARCSTCGRVSCGCANEYQREQREYGRGR